MADYIGSAGVGELAAALRRMPVETRRELRPALRRAGNRVKSRAAGNAAWSSRIPPSLAVVLSTSMRRSAVAISARASVAPHARPYEGITGAGSFRHPVFGGDVWVAQATRPFLAPAALAEQAAVVEELGQAVTKALNTL